MAEGPPDPAYLEQYGVRLVDWYAALNWERQVTQRELNFAVQRPYVPLSGPTSHSLRARRYPLPVYGNSKIYETFCYLLRLKGMEKKNHA
jgi:hypothetical protein